jgi:hypothetical protein
MDPPDGHGYEVTAECSEPGDCVLIVGVDEGAVDIEDGDLRQS